MKGHPLKSTRQRFQAGTIRKVHRKTGFVWEYRYRDNSQPGSPLRQITLSGTLYPTESKALAALQPLLLKINGEDAFVQKRQATFGTLIDRYIEAERLNEIKALPPGEAFVKDGVQYSTACSYLTSLNRYIRPRWSDTLLTDVKPAVVDVGERGELRSVVSGLWQPRKRPQPFKKSHRASRNQRCQQAPQEALHPDRGAVPRSSRTTGRTLQTDGAGCHVSGLAGE
jgi:hypothetical protein